MAEGSNGFQLVFGWSSGFESKANLISIYGIRIIMAVLYIRSRSDSRNYKRAHRTQCLRVLISSFMFRHPSSKFYITRNLNQRLFSASRPHPIRRALLTRRTLARTTLGALTLGSLAWASTTVFADADADLADLQGHAQYRIVPFSDLIRTYVVFSMCSIPWLVDVSPMILKTFTSVPVVREVTEGFLRMTFFKQASYRFGSSWV